jgi:hypothetical protein
MKFVLILCVVVVAVSSTAYMKIDESCIRNLNVVREDCSNHILSHRDRRQVKPKSKPAQLEMAIGCIASGVRQLGSGIGLGAGGET